MNPIHNLKFLLFRYHFLQTLLKILEMELYFLEFLVFVVFLGFQDLFAKMFCLNHHFKDLFQVLL